MGLELYLVWPAFLTGLGIASSLVISIGPQNTFLIKQGIARKHIFFIVVLCIFFDICLITIGVTGSSMIVLQWPWLIKVIAWCGVALLLLYAFRSYKSVINPSTDTVIVNVEHRLRDAILTTIIVTFLNPCAYLDTVVIVGGVSSQFSGDEKFSYWLGCIITSVVWFSLIGILSFRLAPFFYKPITWKILNAVIGSTLIATATQLIWRFW
ncbi:MAG: LysE family transporter [Candidatus Competibacter denitrificans]|jgi:L-lysine exporter family protein LysE/ArgO